MKKVIVIILLFMILIAPVFSQTVRPENSIATTEDIVIFNPQMIKLLSIFSAVLLISLTIIL